jgi:hypothetical protein
MNKKILLDSLISHVLDKLNTIDALIQSSITSRNNNTKSSAGDKHETSRAKIQLDIDNYQQQKIVISKQLTTLKSIEITKNCLKVEMGALIETNFGLFFIAIGLGKWTIENKEVFVISLASPIGKFMKNKIELSKFNFRKLSYKIFKIS